MSANGRKLFLGGLTKTTTTEQLFEAFGKFGQVVDAVVMERNGNPRGFGFVTFKDKSSLANALAGGVTIDGRLVDVKRAVPEEEMDFCPSKVFVGGLSQNVDKAGLKRHFETFGEVRDAVVMMDRATSRSRGFGFVRFATPDAVEAVLRTPHLLDGQWIDVKRAQPAEQLPPPKYPRSRDEAKKPMKRAAKDEQTFPLPADANVGFDAQLAAASAGWAMWNMMMQQGMHGMPMPGMMPHMGGFEDLAGANPFFPQAAAQTSPAEIEGLFASMDLGKPSVKTNTKDKIPKPMNSPLSDLSNVIDSTQPSPAKSPSKSPEKSSFHFNVPCSSPIGRKANPLLDITAHLQSSENPAAR